MNELLERYQAALAEKERRYRAFLAVLGTAGDETEAYYAAAARCQDLYRLIRVEEERLTSS